LLGMVAATVRARGHLSPVELHAPDGMRQSDHALAYGCNGAPARRAGAARSTDM
jgi:hypothetical protein